MRNAYGDALFNLMARNEKLITLIADNDPVRFADMQKEYAGRVLNFGIAECNMVGAAAALANEGLIPVVFAINSFLVYRALNFINCDICRKKLNVKFVGASCGVIMNKFGPTHHSTEDIAALRALPNLTLLSPASAKEVAPVLEKAVSLEGPVFIRLGKAFETEIYETSPRFEIGKSSRLRDGNDITVIAAGSIIADAIEAAKLLETEGFTAEIVNMSTIKPLDEAAVIASAKKTGRIVTVEEHSIYGGLGCAVSECLLKAGVPLKGFDIMGFNDTFCTDYGWHRDLKRAYGLSPEHIFERCKKLL
ncbi:MAG: transketolase family protein [Spirochaetaceae bacterium]|jgi:transketolase|nr:transketolase family protein [Spirochaetaceae bacterium]